MDRLAILIVAYDSEPEARELSLSLIAQRHPSYVLDVVVIDNGSDVPVTLTEEQVAAGCRVIRFETNFGYGGALRRGIATLSSLGCEYDYYFFSNSDIRFADEAIFKLWSVLRQHPNGGAAGPVVYYGQRGSIWGARGRVSPLWGATWMTAWDSDQKLPRWSFIPGCSVLVRREAYEAVSGISDRYHMYYEDAHFGVALQKQGWELFVVPSSHAYHDVLSMRDRVPTPYFAFYFTRNNLYFWRENFNIPVFIQLPRALYAVVRNVILPLYRARSVSSVYRCLLYSIAGLVDGFFFLYRRDTPFERRLFRK